MLNADYHKHIQRLDTDYQYDVSFMRDLLELSPQGYAHFHNFLPLASYNEHLSVVDFWVAKLASMKTADCGDCLQLNVHFAREAGIPGMIIRSCVDDPSSLDPELYDLFSYCKQTLSLQEPDEELNQRIHKRYNKGQLLELGLCIASASVFPLIKRTAGYMKNCRLIDFDNRYEK